jgi:Tfp pilus assembly protein PilX
MPALHLTTRPRQRGAAALLVVVVLFFILALVTAYAGRNLIFEQRTSVNNQRAAQAFEAAESGLDFAIGLLGSGRIDATCQPSSDVTLTTFRQRMLTQDVGGNFIAAGAQPNLRPTCMLLTAGATCSCPGPAAGAPVLAPPVGLLVPTFQVRFETTGIAQPGVVRAIARGCSSIGNQCYAAEPANADALAEVSVLLGMNSALATPPSAALTVGRTLNLNGSAVRISNTDVPTRGVTIDAGGVLVNDGNAQLSSVPGTPTAASIIASDASLSTLVADRMFVSVFGMDRTTYRTQPAAVRVTCGGGCDTAVATAISDNPGRIVWVEGPLTIDSNRVFGSAASPVMLFVQGNLTVSANLQLYGVIYLHDPSNATTWTTTAGNTLIRGAVIAEGALSMQGTPAISFDPDVLRTINLTQGSMVRVPGSWRDFAAGS